jgi:hypothetical protein
MNGFEEPLFREFEVKGTGSQNGLIKSNNSDIKGKTKVTVEEESQHGIKIILKKDENETVQEIKFVCSCGQSKSIILDYSE